MVSIERSKIDQAIKRMNQLQSSAWKGPFEDGVSQSILQRYMGCKERFRCQYVLGLHEVDKFVVAIEYGQMWHICEEFKAANRMEDISQELVRYVKELCKQFPFDQKQILKWYNVCKVQFPIYCDYWKEQEDELNRKPFFQEKVFEIPYELPSGRTVVLRGKMDGVDIIKNKYWLQENKSKGTVSIPSIQKQLTFDLQSMMYLIALQHFVDESEVGGIRYNVVRRPLSGGKGTIRQKKGSKNVPAETDDEYYERLKNILAECPEEYYFRWKVPIKRSEIDKYRHEFFNPILENLLDDYEWWNNCIQYGNPVFDYQTRKVSFPHHQNRHWRYPYGPFNPVSRGMDHYLDDFIDTGNKVGLIRRNKFFGELD